LLLENDFVRLIDACIPPGEKTLLHTHRWPAALYVLKWSDFVRRDGEGKTMLDSRSIKAASPPQGALWSEPLPPHTLENVGDVELQVISVEVKRSKLSLFCPAIALQ
jgi:hypothetical protein